MKVYEIVTEKIIEMMENAGKWEKPWININSEPFNAISNRKYNGLNIVLLGSQGFQSGAFASFKQWKSKGCTIKKGAKSNMVTFWNIGKKEEDDEEKKFFFLKYYNVFNSEQVDGDFAREVEAKQEQEKDLRKNEMLPKAQSIVDGFMSRENIGLINTDRAFYRPSTDEISMPLIGQFDNSENYYSTFFHEMVHSTGNEKRLNRTKFGRFGSPEYAKEELVAELGSAFVNAKIGLSSEPREDHAQYLASWIKVLKNDKRFIISASSAAQKACDFIFSEEV